MIGQARAVLNPVGYRGAARKIVNIACTTENHHGNKKDLIAVTVVIVTTGNDKKQRRRKQPSIHTQIYRKRLM
jgi:hypothetical protein